MDIQKASAWANVGNFVVGCLTVYLVWHSQYPQTATAQVSHVNSSVWIFLAGLVLAGTLHVAAAVVQGNTSNKQTFVPASTVPPSAPLPATLTQGRIFVGADITPTILCGYFKQQYTHVQAEKLIQPYKDMWMQVSGTVANVRTRISGTYAMVRLETGADTNSSLLLLFDQEWLGRVSMLLKGSKVTAIGQIEEVDGLSVQLKRCELVP